MSPEQEPAYESTSDKGRRQVAGYDPEAVGTATARVARDVVRGALLRTGWAVLHASAVADPDGRRRPIHGGVAAGLTDVGHQAAFTDGKGACLSGLPQLRWASRPAYGSWSREEADEEGGFGRAVGA